MKNRLKLKVCGLISFVCSLWAFALYGFSEGTFLLLGTIICLVEVFNTIKELRR